MPAILGASTVVLVVEDDPQVRELHRTALRHAGYAVVAVDDGLTALQYLEGHTPDAVVLDLGLPRVDGRDVHREMAAHGLTDRVPVIVVTGQIGAIEEKDFACVLYKPVTADQLIDAVRNCLRRKKVARSSL